LNISTKMFHSNNIGCVKLPKNSDSCVNPLMIEKWLEDFICESEKINIPSTFMRLEKKTPLARYSIDTDSLLHTYNLDKKNVERIYRTIFIYSTGFYDNISDIIQHCNHKDELISRIWLVYNIMLE